MVGVEETDVIIVGGGPSGAACAWAVRSAGLRVVVVDRANFPRDKVCAGWITPALVAELGITLRDYATANTLQPITGFRVGLVGGNSREVNYARAVSYGIRRTEFDRFLLERSGARLRLGRSLESLSRDGDDNWVVNGAFTAPLLVGAGGHFCPIARRLGAKRGHAVIAAQEAEYFLEDDEEARCKVLPHVPELFIARDLNGFGWAFRKGRYLNIGMGRKGGLRINEHVGEFIDFLKRSARISPATAKRLRGHAYTMYRDSSRDPVGDRVLLVGDAAGVAARRSGEGIRPAVESGLIAAQSLVSAHGAGGFTQHNLNTYRRALHERFGGRRHARLAAHSLVPRSLYGAVGRRLIGRRWFAQNVLLERWLLQRNTQPLMPLFSRGGTGKSNFEATPVVAQRKPRAA